MDTVAIYHASTMFGTGRVAELEIRGAPISIKSYLTGAIVTVDVSHVRSDNIIDLLVLLVLGQCPLNLVVNSEGRAWWLCSGIQRRRTGGH